ncbi:MAG: DUF1254 domain-containing protein [Pseudomonadota bacterium]
MERSEVRTVIAATVTLVFCAAGCSAPDETSDEGTEPVDSIAQFFAEGGRVVTAASYPTDETSRQLLINQGRAGINTFRHNRELTPTDNQPVVRMNRDTYYSIAVVDVSKGATVTIPEVGDGRYVSVQPITEDHRIQRMSYGPGTFELATHTGTHLGVVVRLDGTIAATEAASIQDQMKIEAASNNRFTAMPIDKESFVAVENALRAKLPALIARDGRKASVGMLTAPDDESSSLFDQEKYEIGAAVGWGGAQIVDNIYEVSGDYPVAACYQATFSDPQNEAFWSITVYDKAGFMFNDVANVNSNLATPNPDGTYTVSFGCGEDAPNNLQTANESGVFNLSARHYRPSERVRLEGFRILPNVRAVAEPTR